MCVYCHTGLGLGIYRSAGDCGLMFGPYLLGTLADAYNTQLALGYRYNDPNDPERVYYRSDHYNFAKHKVPVIFYTTGDHADYHQATDDVDKIEFPLMAKRDQLVFHTAWELVNRDNRIVVDSNKP